MSKLALAARGLGPVALIAAIACSQHDDAAPRDSGRPGGATISAASASSPTASSTEVPPPPGCKWVETEYHDEVKFTTCDAIATISVRHMSLGPGACAVSTTSSLGDEVGVLAPPGAFTGWQKLLEHTAAIGVTVTDDVKCDTGVRSQVRYSAKS